MFLTNRHQSKEYLHLLALFYRTSLEEKDLKQLNRLNTGYLGEVYYDQIFDQVGHDHLYIYRDIYLSVEDSTTQYDALIVTDQGITVNEIKNYSGTYTVADENFILGDFVLPDYPFSQLRRAVGKLRRLSIMSKMKFTVSGKLIFPHEDCRLNVNDENLKKNIIERSQLRRYLLDFKNHYSGEYAKRIVAVIRNHIVDNPYFKRSIDFNYVKKGLYCHCCKCFDLLAERYHLRCSSCNAVTTKETHIIRAISDYKYLFGKLDLTTERLYQFTGGYLCRRTLQRYLNKYCYRNGDNKAATYTFKYYDYEEAIKDQKIIRRYKDD